MFELKPISKEAIPRAMTKAERYRLLNEPRDAESICRDILRTEPEHQEALVTLILSLTDQFGRGLRVSVNHAQELLPRLTSEYAREYYEGVICERWAKARMSHNTPGYVVYDWLVQAMTHYENAHTLEDRGNDDALLRYNACARIIKRNEQLRPRPEGVGADAVFQDDVPVA